MDAWSEMERRGSVAERWSRGPILFTPLCMCHPEETVKAVGPFYLVSRPGEVKDPTQGNGKPTMDSLTLEKDNFGAKHHKS